MRKFFKNLMGKLSDLAMYKFLSIVGFVEFISIPAYLIYIYSIENPQLRPLGTMLIFVFLSLVVFPVNLLLTLGLFGESKLRKNFADIKRRKLTHIGFALYSLTFVVGIFTFLFSVYVIVR